MHLLMILNDLSSSAKKIVFPNFHPNFHSNSGTIMGSTIKLKIIVTLFIIRILVKSDQIWSNFGEIWSNFGDIC